MAVKRTSPVQANAMPWPIFDKLRDKRVVLASASPRRKDILANVGFIPEIVPSTFKENLPKSMFQDSLADYPVATAGEKALEVYSRLMKENDEDPADIVISSDTVVIFPPEKDTREENARNPGQPVINSEILEKPANRHEQQNLLELMSGRTCEVVTAVVIVHPTIEAPGYKLQSMHCSTIVHFFENDKETIEAYVDHGEGEDRAGGFAIQGLGGLLIDRIEGSFDNCVGFPSSQFWKWMGELSEDGAFDDL